jgi:hypothetical protein
VTKKAPFTAFSVYFSLFGGCQQRPSTAVGVNTHEATVAEQVAFRTPETAAVANTLNDL